jgi:hypothetical protein
VYPQAIEVKKQLYTEEKERAKMQGAKEKAANVGASAKCGMEKTKATVDAKVCLFLFLLVLYTVEVERYSFYRYNGINDMWLSRWKWGKPVTQRRKKPSPERKRRE